MERTATAVCNRFGLGPQSNRLNHDSFKARRKELVAKGSKLRNLSASSTVFEDSVAHYRILHCTRKDKISFLVLSVSMPTDRTPSIHRTPLRSPPSGLPSGPSRVDISDMSRDMQLVSGRRRWAKCVTLQLRRSGRLPVLKNIPTGAMAHTRAFAYDAITRTKHLTRYSIPSLGPKV